MKKEAEQIVISNKNIREIVISHCNVEYDIVIADCLVKRDIVVRRNVTGGDVKVNTNSRLEK